MSRPLSPPLLALALAACVAPSKPPPVPVREPVRPAVALPPPPPVDWRDAPLTAGTWRYADGRARFGAVLIVACDLQAREVRIVRTDARPAASITLTTSYGTRAYPVGALAEGLGWRMDARDPALDRLAFSRGRFMVEGGGPRLILPAWAEVARVVEDCRG